MSIPESEAEATILVVEDDSETAQMIRTLLERQGYSVLTAHNGEEALDALGLNERARPKPSIQPDLILLDVLMPGPGGYEICERIRQDEKSFWLESGRS